MKLIYKRKFNGDFNSLPKREHHQDSVKFKEFDNIKEMTSFFTIGSFIILFIFGVIFCIRSNINNISFIGIILSLITLIPHEILHAICFKGNVYLYLTKEGAFVVGTESMSKLRYIIMSLLPNIIFGFIPFIIFLIYPTHNIIGTFGFFSISMGMGDYYNVYNAIVQMPKNSREYMYQQNSYWYMPKDKNDK